MYKGEFWMKKNNSSKRYNISKKTLELFKGVGITEQNRTRSKNPNHFINKSKYDHDDTKHRIFHPTVTIPTDKLIFRYIVYTEVSSGILKYELDSWASTYPYLNQNIAAGLVIFHQVLTARST